MGGGQEAKPKIRQWEISITINTVDTASTGNYKDQTHKPTWLQCWGTVFTSRIILHLNYLTLLSFIMLDQINLYSWPISFTARHNWVWKKQVFAWRKQSLIETVASTVKASLGPKNISHDGSKLWILRRHTKHAHGG